MTDNVSACVDLCPTLLELHIARKARLKRIADRAFEKQPQPDQIASPPSRPTPREIEAGWEIAAATKAEQIIRDTNALWRARRPRSVASIQQTTAEYYNMPVAVMIGGCRAMETVKARQISIYLAVEIAKVSIPDVARRSGARDHSTAHHAIKRVKMLMATNPQYAREVAEIRSIILGAAS